MSNGQSQDSTEIVLAERIMAEAITNPWGFITVIFGLVILLAAYGAFVKNPFWMMRKKLVTEIAQAVAEAIQKDD